MDYPYNYQHEQGEYGSYEQHRHHSSTFISDTSSLNTTYINNNHQMNQINLSNNNALNPSLITNMTMNNGYSSFQSNQLIEQQIPPRMAMNMNMNMNMMNINNTQHLLPQHGQIQNMNIQNHINIHIQPYGHNHNHNHHHPQFHTNYNQNNNNNRNRNRGNYNHNNRRRGQRHHNNNHSQHRGHGHGHNNNANNPRGFQPKDAEFPWHLPPRLQRARAQKKMKKKMKQQRKQMQRENNTYYQIQHGPLYLYNASIPPPPSRQAPNPPHNNDYNHVRDEEQYPPLPDIKSIPNDGINTNKTPSSRSTRKRRRRGRQGNNNKKDGDVIDDGQKKNNMVLHKGQTQEIVVGDNGNNGNNGNDGDYAFMHQFVKAIDDNDGVKDIEIETETLTVPGLDGIIDLNLNDNHFKSMEQEIVDNVFLLQQDHEHIEHEHEHEHEQSLITNDNVSQYSSATTYGGNNNVSVTIGELFGDISCSSSYTKSNTNSPNPKKNKLYHNNNDIVSLSKIEW